MPRRYYEEDCLSSDEDEPPRKKISNGIVNNTNFQQGEIITDINNKNWKLGKTIGTGGFGEIYEASEVTKAVKTDNYYVAKVEKHTSGPLFVEINCYLRIAKTEMIDVWKTENDMKFLGMPHYVASGSCYHNNEKYRFLLLPKYKKDLGKILHEKKLFNIKTVSNICIQILDVLEYIHARGYIHSDIKASNIMLGSQTKSKPVYRKMNFCQDKPPARQLRNTIPKPVRKIPKRNLRPTSCVNYCEDIPYLEDVLIDYNNYDNTPIEEEEVDNTIENELLNQVYLVDFGLATKYLMSNGEHKEFSADERRAHAGTVLFCSRDAHKGIPSRRSDLESLAYNMVYWLTGALPWIEDLEQPADVEKKKIRCFRHLKEFLNLCFNNNFPHFVMDYFEYLDKLQFEEIQPVLYENRIDFNDLYSEKETKVNLFEENPDYDYCRGIFKKAIKLYGYKRSSDLDFDNLEGWGRKQAKLKPSKSNKKIISYHSFLKTSPLMPLHSNIVFKRPKLRKKVNDIKIQDSMMNWSKILIMDPEMIIKQARERKVTEGSEPDVMNLSAMDIDSMNPTYAMLEVYNKCMDRETSPKYKPDSDRLENIEGYTQAMMAVYLKMQEKKELENSMLNTQHNCSNKRKTRRVLKRSVSPVERTSRSRSQNGRKKEPAQSTQLKKSRSTSFKRSYRLRG